MIGQRILFICFTIIIFINVLNQFLILEFVVFHVVLVNVRAFANCV